MIIKKILPIICAILVSTSLTGCFADMRVADTSQNEIQEVAKEDKEEVDAIEDTENNDPLEELDQQKQGFTQSELEMMDTVNTEISDLIDSEEFKVANIDTRKTMSVDLLTKLQKQGLINEIGDTDNDVIVFSYANGLSGGIMVTEFSPYLN